MIVAHTHTHLMPLGLTRYRRWSKGKRVRLLKVGIGLDHGTDIAHIFGCS